MSAEERDKWNAAYRAGRFQSHFEGSRSVVVDWAEPLLPHRSRILDLGSGILRNSRRLAEKGHDVLAVDVAREAFQHADPWPGNLQPLVADLDHWPIPPAAFDLIIMVHYLNRKLLPLLGQALRPGGWLALEIRSPLPQEEHQPMPRYWLRSEEVETLFADLELAQFQVPTTESKSVKALLRRG